MRTGKPIYIDLCALERPYDDKSYYRIRLEAAAVELIISQVRNGIYKLYYSPVHEEEISQISRDILRTDLELLLYRTAQNSKPLVKDADALERRGWQFESAGLGVADAFHLAYAEALIADFITCDDELIKRCHRCPPEVWCGTPVDFCKKEGLI
jgi:predicted nucleic acid-binding protein